MTDIVSKQTRHMGLPLNYMNRYSAFNLDCKVCFLLIEISVKKNNHYCIEPVVMLFACFLVILRLRFNVWSDCIGLTRKELP